MPLVSAKDFDLTPDISPLVQQIGAALRQRATSEREDEKIAQKTKALEAQKAVKTAGAQALRVRGMKDFSTQRKEIAILAQNAIKRGEDPKQFVDALNIQNQDEFNLNLTRIATAAGDADKLIAQGLKAQEQEQFEPVKDEKGNIVAQRNVQTGQVISDPRAAAAAKIKAKSSESKGSEVQSSSILDDGTVQLVYKDGTVEIKQPDEAGKELVRRGKERGVDLQQRRAQGRGLGKDAAKIATKLFGRVGTMKANNRTLRKVIAEVEAGAETGPLSAKLPSLRAASVRLDQVRSELGLDVVGSVTFGALSEGELNLAMSTALPTKLDGPELVKWAQEKIDAQEKLVNYLEDQAIFLSDKGNTPAMWLEQQRGQTPQAETQAAPQESTQAISATGRTATNPQTGEKVQEMSDGSWSPL